MTTKIVIDGLALVEDHFSDIGHYLQGMVVQLDKQLSLEANQDVEAYLVVPFKRVDRLVKYGFKNIRIKKVPLQLKVWRRLVSENALPPMDRFFGKACYYFPNYVKWPLKSAKSITAIHDLSFEEVPQFSSPGNDELVRKEVLIAVKESDRIFALTQTMKEVIRDFYNLEDSSIVVASCAADLTHFYRKSEKYIFQTKRKYGIQGDYILSIGNIEPRKNQISLLRAYRNLPQDVRDKYALVIAGAGKWKAEEFSAELDDALNNGEQIVMLEGRVTDDEMPALYSGAAMMIYPSFYEGFGMPIIEAMACGTPVIVSNVSVMPEVAGDAAFFIDPNSVDSIYNAIMEVHGLTAEQRRDVHFRGITRARFYKWSDSVQRLLDTARELAKA